MESNNIELPLISLSKLCPICTITIIDTIIPQCDHAFCSSCIQRYLELQITEGQVLHLCCPSCQLQLTPSFIQSHISVALFDKYTEFYYKKTLESNKTFRWCPQPSCQGHDSFKTTNKLKCSQCNFEFCYLCSSAWHENSDCRKFEGSLALKACPSCKVRTERSGGCPQMSCVNCSLQWCWYCETPISSHDIAKCLRVNNGFDAYWFFIVLMILFPLVVVFLLPLIAFAIKYFDDEIHTGELLEVSKVIQRYYLVIMIGSIVLSPFIMILTLVFLLMFLSIRAGIHFRPFRYEDRLYFKAISGTLAIFISFIALALIILASCIILPLAPIAGIILMLGRLVIIIKHCLSK